MSRTLRVHTMYEIKHSKQQINIKTFAQSSGSLESFQVSSNVCARCFISSVSIRSFFDDKFSLISTYSYDYVECLLVAAWRCAHCDIVRAIDFIRR